MGLRFGPGGLLGGHLGVPGWPRDVPGSILGCQNEPKGVQSASKTDKIELKNHKKSIPEKSYISESFFHDFSRLYVGMQC